MQGQTSCIQSCADAAERLWTGGTPGYDYPAPDYQETFTGDIPFKVVSCPEQMEKWADALFTTAGPADNSEAMSGGIWSTDKFDGSYTDDNFPCDGCARTINADGGFGNVYGRDTASGEQWNGFIEYDSKKVKMLLKYPEDSGMPDKTLTGTWFSKKGEKGIKWSDGGVWNKMEYKLVMTPFQEEMQMERERERLRATGQLAAGVVGEAQARNRR